MPGTALKPPLVRPDFITDLSPKETVTKNPVKSTQSSLNTKTTISEDGSRGAGEVVAKRVKKVKKLDDEKIGKKVSATISDKIPKKIAQRPKDTTAPNKASEKVSLDCLDKAKAASGDKVPLPKEEGAEEPRTKTETRKVFDDTADKKPRGIPRKVGTKVLRRSQKAPSQKKASATVEDQNSQGPLTKAPVTDDPENEFTKNEDTIKVVNEEPQSATIASSSHGSYSFLEKLQLGVKAYFNSRNSFIGSDKNKKEGGNQTRARVRKGVTEDAQKTDPGFDFKNNVCILESDLLLDQLRLYSNLGGESSNFSKNKPKISKNVNSKKLKRCVRIHIPRKGYFYRSAMQCESPEQPSSSPFELLEPCVKSQSKSKIQISGLAPTGSQLARTPKKKRVKKRQKPSPEVDFILYSDSTSGSPSRLSSPKSLVDYDFNDDRLFSFEKHGGGKNGSFITELFPEFREREGDKPPVSGNSHRNTNKTPTGIEGFCFEILESMGKKPTAFETLTNCLSSVLRKDEIFHSLEITPINPEEDTNIQEENEKPLITPVPVDYMSSSSFDGGMNPTTVLMGEIDLHLELQNYLKAFNSVSASKTRTKNTLHSSNTINPEELLQEEQFEGDEKNPNSQSSTSLGDEINRRCLGELEEERVESRLVPSQTQLSNVLRQMRKIKSTEQTCISDNWMDGYEKVLPLEAELSRGLCNTIYSSGESIFGNLWTKTPPKVQKAFQPQSSPFSIIDMIEIYKNILKHYEKLQRRGKKNIGCSLSSNLISYLHEKYTERQSRINLSNFSREVSNRQGWKHRIRKVKPIYLQEFVDLFQKVIRSSMPIRLITHLNNIISTWGYRSEYYVKRLKKRIETAKELAKRRKIKSMQQEVPAKDEKLPSLENILTPSSSVLKKEPSPSKNLQTVLETFFNSEGEDLPGLSNLKGKVLVDVKLAGDQIRVNDLSFVKNKIPPRKKTDTDEASELIIETVGESEITDVLCEKTRMKKKKIVKRRSKPKGRVKKIEKCNENEKTVSEFEYDEVELRAQHPIDPITESSELKVFQGRVTSSSDTKITEKTPPDWDLMKKLLQNDNLLKDFVNKPKPTEAEKIELDIKSYLKNLSFLMKSQPPEIVKSFVDIDANSAMWNTVYKTPSAWSRTFFCLSALEDPQQNPFTGNNKDKKLGNISKIQKKMQEFAMQRLKPRAAILKPCAPYLNSVSYLDKEECCSLELLYSDKKPPRKVTGAKIHASSLTNLIQGTQAEISNPTGQIDVNLNNQSTDDGSFSLDLVHSDSFLKRFSHASILERDTKMLFKNNADLKFSPNRVIDGKKDPKPFVTFVLTPEQFEKANLSADDAVVIQKKKESVVMVPKSPSESEDAKNEAKLKSIENFIETMSTLNARAKRKKKKMKAPTIERKCNPPVFSERKLNTRCQTCQMLSKKETPKRKKLAKIIYADSRSTIKSDRSSGKKAKADISKSFIDGGATHSAKPAEKKSSHQVVKKTTECEKKAEDKTTNNSKISLNLEDIPLDLLEALKDSINQVEDLKKKKTLSKMEEDLEKKLKEKTEVDKTPKSFVLKIYCEKRGDLTKVEEIKKEEVQQKTETEEEKNENENKNLKVIEEVKEQDAEDEDFPFFDAVEKNFKDEIGALEEMKKNSEPHASDIPTPEAKPRPLPSHAEDRLPSENPPAEKSEEIFNKISDSLIEGQITYSLLLLDYFLKKREKFLAIDENQQKETQMSNLERNAWQKIVLILDALSEIVEKNGEDTLKAHLQSTKSVVTKILQHNVSRLNDLQKFNSSVTQLPCEKEDDRDAFDVVRQCLIHLKEKEENVKEESVGNEGKECEEMTAVSNRKEAVLMEIRQMNNKLVEDLKSLEKLFLVSNCTRSSSSVEEKTPSKASEVSAKENLEKTSGCTQLMQCLMKVWNTRMSLNTYTSDCCR